MLPHPQFGPFSKKKVVFFFKKKLNFRVLPLGKWHWALETAVVGKGTVTKIHTFPQMHIKALLEKEKKTLGGISGFPFQLGYSGCQENTRRA